MDIMRHAKDMATSIIANQTETTQKIEEGRLDSVARTVRKKTRTIGPTTQIKVGVHNPAIIINEKEPGGIEELVVISPSKNFSVIIESGGTTKLNKTWTQLSGISAQAIDIAAFTDPDGSYILNIKDYRWQENITLTLKSTSGSILFSQVYANWYAYGV